MGSETSQYHKEKKRKDTILILLLDASRAKMTDRFSIPKVVASEMGSVQTYCVKSVDASFGKINEAKGTSRCPVRVVSRIRLFLVKQAPYMIVLAESTGKLNQSR